MTTLSIETANHSYLTSPSIEFEYKGHKFLLANTQFSHGLSQQRSFIIEQELPVGSLASGPVYIDVSSEEHLTKEPFTDNLSEQDVWYDEAGKDTVATHYSEDFCRLVALVLDRYLATI